MKDLDCIETSDSGPTRKKADECGAGRSSAAY